MLGIFAGFGKIRVGVFQHGILIPVPQLFLQANVPGCRMILSFHGTLCSILITIALCHNSISYEAGH